MRPTTILGLLVFATSPAFAGHRHCTEQSDVVGYQHCSRFGLTGWTGRTLSWELGVTMQRIQFGSIDQDVQSGSSSNHFVARRVLGSATGARLRNLYGLTDHFYLATELTFGRLMTAPQLAITPTAREVMPVANTTTGSLFEGLLAAGTRSSLGFLTLGTELAFGPRMILFSSSRLPSALFYQGGPTLEARAHASIWLSMHWTIGVMAAASAFDRHDVSITFGLGLHAFPYDGGR